MHIISLEVENFMGIRAARIPVGAGVTTIAGRNGQGKTSLLQAIRWAIGGDKLAPEEPIRRGAAKAEVLLKTDAWTIERRRTKGGGKVEIRSNDTPEGKLIPNPQALLDRVVSDLTFNPMRFLEMKPAERAQVIRQTLKIEDELVDLDKQEKAAEAERLATHREKERLTKTLASMPIVGTNLQPIDVVQTKKDYQDALAARELKAAARKQLAEQKTRGSDLTTELLNIQAEIAEVEAWINSNQPKIEAMPEPDADAIARKLAEASEHNVGVEKTRQREQMRLEAEAATAEHTEAEKKVERIRAKRNEVIAGVPIPVTGMVFDGRDITLDGIPFDQANMSHKMNAAVALGLAQGREFPLILVENGSLYDSQTIELLAQIAEHYKAQVIVEKVTDGQRGPYITIEDGEVVADEPAQAPAAGAP